MAETIINSNQLRASGDTSSQTLIGANQIRQSGDSSSQTLLNKNQIAQSQGTLNAEIVGTPTISDDFILSNFDNSNYLKFNPANPYQKNWTITTKFRVADLTKKGCLFMCSPDQKGIKLSYGDDGSGQSGMSLIITDSSGSSWWNLIGGYTASNVYTTANQWLWVKVTFTIDAQPPNQADLVLLTSTDGENYTEKLRNTYFNGANLVNLSYEQVGTGDSNNTIEIDLKETKYYIDDVLSWEAVSF